MLEAVRSDLGSGSGSGQGQGQGQGQEIAEGEGVRWSGSVVERRMVPRSNETTTVHQAVRCRAFAVQRSLWYKGAYQDWSTALERYGRYLKMWGEKVLLASPPSRLSGSGLRIWRFRLQF